MLNRVMGFSKTHYSVNNPLTACGPMTKQECSLVTVLLPSGSSVLKKKLNEFARPTH